MKAESEFHTHWVTASGASGSSGDMTARFPYWSFTKTVLATIALQLVETGDLELDAPLSNQPYTLRQLLAHTSGLPDYGAIPVYGRAVKNGEPAWARDEMLDRALQKGMLFKPDDGWSYSNIGYMFIRELIERTTSTPLQTQILDRICKPLGLHSIDLATTHKVFSTTHWKQAANYDPNWVYHGCLIGNAPDAAKLLRALFTGQLMNPETLKLMRDPKPLGGPIPARPWSTCGYALGLMCGEIDGLGRGSGHSGAGPFSVNAVYHFPDKTDPITIAVFTDGNDEGRAEYEVARIAHEQLFSSS